MDEGEKIGLKKGEKIGFDKKLRIAAKRMVIDGMPLEKVARMTELSREVVQELAEEVAAGLRDED